MDIRSMDWPKTIVYLKSIPINALKKQFYEISLKVGGKLLREVKESPAEIVCTDCPLSALQIEQGTQKIPLHPVEILHRAYGFRI